MWGMILRCGKIVIKRVWKKVVCMPFAPNNSSERPINSQADTHQLFVEHDWQNRAIREQFIMLLRNTTAVVLI